MILVISRIKGSGLLSSSDLKHLFVLTGFGLRRQFGCRVGSAVGRITLFAVRSTYPSGCPAVGIRGQSYLDNVKDAEV